MGSWSEALLSTIATAAAQPWVLLGLAIGLGFVHALLPGHGKAMLAARHAALGEARPMVAAFSAMLDGLLVAGSRTVVGAALVIGTAQLGSTLGRAPSPGMLQAVAGCVLLVIAGHMLLDSVYGRGAKPRTTVPMHREPTGDAAGATAVRQLTLPLVVLALTPEPLSISLVALVLSGPATLGVSLVGFALGLGGALGLAALLGAAGGRGRFGALFERRNVVVQRALAVLIGLSGAAILVAALR